MQRSRKVCNSTVEEVRGSRFLRAHQHRPGRSRYRLRADRRRFYYATVASVVEAGVQPVYSLRVETDDHSFITNGFVSHNTGRHGSPSGHGDAARNRRETVDFIPNYDGRVQEPTVPAEPVPNLFRQRLRRSQGRHGHQHPAAQPVELAEAVY